jgi:Uma2 family endonuclease
VKTVVLGDPPDVLVSLFAQRKQQGINTHDELWNGDYHTAPAAAFRHGRVQGLLFGLFDRVAQPLGFIAGLEFNLGEPGDYRVPDLGVHRHEPSGSWVQSAMIVVEVRSPDDETYEKFPFYLDHHVEEILVVDLTTQTVEWFIRSADAFAREERSELLGVSVSDVATTLEW